MFEKKHKRYRYIYYIVYIVMYKEGIGAESLEVTMPDPITSIDDLRYIQETYILASKTTILNFTLLQKQTWNGDRWEDEEE